MEDVEGLREDVVVHKTGVHGEDSHEQDDITTTAKNVRDIRLSIIVSSQEELPDNLLDVR
jgi:hypothetical protein